MQLAGRHGGSGGVAQRPDAGLRDGPDVWRPAAAPRRPVAVLPGAGAAGRIPPAGRSAHLPGRRSRPRPLRPPLLAAAERRPGGGRNRGARGRHLAGGAYAGPADRRHGDRPVGDGGVPLHRRDLAAGEAGPAGDAVRADAGGRRDAGLWLQLRLRLAAPRLGLHLRTGRPASAAADRSAAVPALSPRFLVAQGRVEQARAVLARLRGGVSEQVEAELRDIQVGLKEESEHSFWELFSGKANLRLRLLTGVALVFLQQATGQPNILSYASPLLRSVGFNSDAAATLASTGFGVVKVVFTVPAVLLVDRVGPKSFLCVGAVAMGMSLAALGTLTLQSHTHLTSLCKSHTHLNHTHLLWDLNRTALDQDDLDLYSSQLPPEWISEEAAGTEDQSGGRTHVEVSSSLKWASLISLLLYVAAFSISLGPMVYVVLSEIFPMGVRGRAVSVVSAVNWATNLLISMTFLTITEKIGVPNIMFLYAAMSFVLLVFVILCVPETKGRTLEEISKELAKKKNFQLRLCRKVQPKRVWSGPRVQQWSESGRTLLSQ
uniref:Solute carrier family 2, facilitated glucose transporter member 10 n=2 Tax=Amphiprion percula TaxID=161767 RepID=A0A3P8SID4_AMPPE